MPNPQLFPYTGNPKNRATEPGKEKWRELNTFDPDELKDPSHYLASHELAAAVNVALELGMPLLLTGEPGCGKSRLADAVAYELGLRNDQDEYRAIRYTVKSDTEGRDLFYHYDTLGRFRNANDPKEGGREAKEFITYHGLGLALLRAMNREQRELLKPLVNTTQWAHLQALPKEGERSVVLIDEIDKAPREVPNDLLTEIEDLSFRVPELGHMSDIKLSGEKNQDDPAGQRNNSAQVNRPIVIITSNSERDLPPAFLRRCIYFHVDPPPFRDDTPDASVVTIEDIVQARLLTAFEKHDQLLKDAIALFRHLQSKDIPLAQKPSVAELLQWLRYLSKHHPDRKTRLKDHDYFSASLGVLLKPHSQQERECCDRAVEDWIKKTFG